MSQNKCEVEARGQDVEAAIEAGLVKLGVGRSDVIIEVVDEGSKGLLGIGSRDAVVRLTSLAAPPSQPAPPAPPVPSVPSVPSVQETAVSAPAPETTASTEVEYEAIDEQDAVPELVRELLDKMGINAEVSVHMAEPDDLTGKQMAVIEINGDDLGALIGPRGETLNSIQYITRLMAGHKLRRRADFVIDVQGYRQRREQALTRLAERMAKKVSARHRPVALEPMSPYERRIIHIALRDAEDVYTQSVGEGKRRKVRILPK